MNVGVGARSTNSHIAALRTPFDILAVEAVSAVPDVAQRTV